MKNHLKRIAAPATWVLDRKGSTFITRPFPGGHSFEFGLALGVVIRDILELSATMAECKKLLNNNEVLVDGKRRKDHRYLVGLFDVISFPGIDQYFRVILDSKGRLVVVPITKKESTLKVCKVLRKNVIKGGKTQIQLHDGKTILTTEKLKVGDSVVLELPTFAIKKVLALKESVMVSLVKGRHAGGLGTLTKIKESIAECDLNGEKIETLSQYLFVVGEKSADMTVNVSK